jgi:hypothetical protein
LMHRPVILAAAVLLAFLAGRYFPAAESPPAGTTPTASISRNAVPTPLPTARAPQDAKAPASPAPAPPATDSAAEKLLGMLEKMAGSRDPSATDRILAEWMAADPDGVTAFLATSPQRDALLQKIAALWARADPAAASAWLAARRDLPGRDAMAAGLASAVAKEDPPAAVQWVASISDPAIKFTAAQETGYEFYRQSDAAAQEALAGMGLPDSATDPVLAAWHTRFTASARRNAQSLASVYNAARAAGAGMDAKNLDDIRTLLTSGVKGSGQFAASTFQVNSAGQTERETAAAGAHLELSGETLSCKPE